MKYQQRLLSILLALALSTILIMPVQAALIENTELFGSTASVIDRNQITKAFERDAARQQLAAFGISHEQAMARIARMTDEEIAQLNQQWHELPAGGDVLGLVVLIFIVFIITDAVGATDIFPFVHPVK